MIEWLNDDSGALIVGANIVLVVVTSAYVLLTKTMAGSAQRTAELADKQLRLSTMPIVLGHKVGARGDGSATVRVFGTKVPALNLSVDVYSQGTKLGGSGSLAIWLPGSARDIKVGTFTLPPSVAYEVAIEYYDTERNAYRTRRTSLKEGRSSVTIEVHDFASNKTEVLVQGTTTANLSPLGQP